MKFSNNSLKKLIKGACYFEINNGYLDAYKYSKAQLDLIKEQICDKCWWDRATFTPGIRIEIETNSDFISFDYKIPYGNQLSARSNSLDVWVDGVLYSIFRTEALKGNFKIDLPKGNKRVVIYLPNDCRFSIKNFNISTRSSRTTYKTITSSSCTMIHGWHHVATSSTTATVLR